MTTNDKEISVEDLVAQLRGYAGLAVSLRHIDFGPRFQAADMIESLRAELEACRRDGVHLHKFFTKYALGPLLSPSCLCCGKTCHEPAISHTELPVIVICKKCRDAAISAGEEGK